MGKIENLREEMLPLLSDPAKLERFILKNSNLPGPRGNIEIGFALADIYADLGVLRKWANISGDEAGVNDPEVLLPFCAAVCLGSIFAKKPDPKLLSILKKLSNDDRWRVREGVCFGFQRMGEKDFSSLEKIFSEWIKDANNLEKRAMLVSLAHPPFLNKENSIFCFDILEKILGTMGEETDHFDVLKKGLDFVISVYVAHNPEYGFGFMKKWAGKSKTIDSSLKSNLKKKRLLNKFPLESKSLMDLLERA